MTAVSGHLTDARFDPEIETDWDYTLPQTLFDAPVRVQVVDTRVSSMVHQNFL